MISPGVMTNDTQIEVPCPRCGIRVAIKIKVRVAAITVVTEAGDMGLAVQFADAYNIHTCPEE